jgi:hypothetical protein
MPLEAFSRGNETHAKPVSISPAYDRGRISQLLRALAPTSRVPAPEGGRITVHAAVSRFAVLYERIRNAVEYREDHLLRKSAIIRILKRQLLLETDPHVIATNLIRELIGAHYLPNGVLPESLIDETALRVRKYQAVVRTRAGGERHARWVLGVIAAELEETLTDPSREKALVTFLYERLSDRVAVKGATLEETERRLQIYVACYRSLIKADDESVAYKLLRAYLPEWMKPEEWLDRPRPIAERLVAVEQRIRDRQRHPLSQRFLRTVKPWAVGLSMLTEALLEEKERAEMLDSAADVHAAVEQIVERREHEARAKLRRGTVRAIIYLFLTKMIFAFVVELPLEYYWYHAISVFALCVNLLFPPVLMFLVGVFIRRPDVENRRRILLSVDELLSRSGPPPQEIRIPRKRRGITLFLMRCVYGFTFFLTFGSVGLVLWRIGFTWVATMIFFFFLCVVSFFGYRLRQVAREIVVVQPRERLSATLVDFFALPVLRMGQWLSQTVSRINVFVFLFDFLIEAPFKLFLNVLEDWLGFMREKKEELTEQ